jgi:hypothetical protein
MIDIMTTIAVICSSHNGYIDFVRQLVISALALDRHASDADSGHPPIFWAYCSLVFILSTEQSRCHDTYRNFLLDV